jgi:PAS domain S-box-containing protein
VYLDDIESAVNEKLELHRQKVWKQITFILILFATSIVITVLVLRFFSKKIQKGVETFAAFFKRSAISYEKMDATDLPFSEFETLALFSNKMLADRKEAEKKLKQREATLRSIFGAVPIGIGLVSNRVIKQVNDRMCEMVGYAHDELLEKSSKILYASEEEYERAGGVKYEQIKAKGTGTVETKLRRKDGQIIDVLLSSTPLNPEDLSEGFTFTALDITEKKREQKEREQLQAQLQRAEKMEAVGTLAGGVAHDLNNILGGLVSYPDLLLMDLPDDSPLREPISIIQKSGKKASAIVDDLLTLARRGVAVKEVANLNDIIAEYLKSPEFQRLKDYHPGVRIETSLEPDLLNNEVSSVHLSKTIMNLISNATEAVVDDGTVTISTRNEYIDRSIKGYDQVRHGDYVVLSVDDNGQGIVPEDLNRIFEPFYTKKHMGRSGTGLGMAVVWGTVKDHNGYIDVKSKRGQGSTFDIYLPATRKELPNKERSGAFEKYLGKGQTVLVVDDVEEQRKIAAMLLSKLGYSVDVVSSGEEAITFLESHSADLLVLDMIMDPGIDGLDTFKKILECHPKQKALIASGFSETERVKEAQRLGAGQYVKKPYTLEKIGLAVKTALERKLE